MRTLPLELSRRQFLRSWRPAPPCRPLHRGSLRRRPIQIGRYDRSLDIRPEEEPTFSPAFSASRSRSGSANHSSSRTVQAPRTNIGTEAVVNAPPDGYSLLLFDRGCRDNATLYDKLDFNFIRDIDRRWHRYRDRFHDGGQSDLFRPRRFLNSSPGPKPIRARSTWRLPALELPPSGRRVVQGDDRHRYAPCTVSGLGTGHDRSARGASAGYFGSVPASDRVHSGRQAARAGLTTLIGSEALPDIPTLGDFVPGYETSHWFGIGAPRGTPGEDIDKLNMHVNAALADPKIKARFARPRRHCVPLLA